MQDLRFALRQLRQNPGFFIIAVLALALGIGANTAIFSVVNGVLLRPLSFPEPDRLVRLHESNLKLGFPMFSIAPGTFLDWQAQNHVFENLAAITSSDFNLTGLDKPERVPALRVSATLFPILRVRPELGRLFLSEEDAPGRNEVALLSRSFWQKRFGGDRQIVGRRITLDGQSRTIIGVVEVPTMETALFVPLSLNDDERKNQGGHSRAQWAVSSQVSRWSKRGRTWTSLPAISNGSTRTRNWDGPQGFGQCWRPSWETYVRL